MKTIFLDFEQPIAKLEDKIDSLRSAQDSDSIVDISEEIGRLDGKSQNLTKDIYAKLTSWQTAQVARHPQRPYTLDYVAQLFTNFEELHGDRSFADDRAIVGGLASFNGQSVMVIGHQKGRDTKEKIIRNFGMPRPEGYRKALRLMRMARKIRHTGIYLCRYPRCLSWHWRRRAWPVRGDRSQSTGHGRTQGAFDLYHRSARVAQAVRWRSRSATW